MIPTYGKSPSSIADGGKVGKMFGMGGGWKGTALFDNN
jgi:hypothetical protein